MFKKSLFTLLAAFGMSAALAAVNLNTATEAELDTLPGIGPATAKAIVEYRTANGPFKSVEDLKKVKGIGDKKLERLRPELTLSGAPAANKPAAPATPAVSKKAGAAAEAAKPTKPQKTQ